MRRLSPSIALPFVLGLFSLHANGMYINFIHRQNYVVRDSSCIPREEPKTPREIYLAKTSRQCYCAAFLPGELLHPDTPDSGEWKVVDDTCGEADPDSCYKDSRCVVENIFDPTDRKFFDCAINTNPMGTFPAALRTEEKSSSQAVNAHCPFYREDIPNQMCRDPAADR